MSSDSADTTAKAITCGYFPFGATMVNERIASAFEGTDATVLVGGDTAFNKDFFDLAESYTPIVFALVLGLSFLLLTVVFRSIVVPIKAIILNLLSVGAAYGLIVLVFQKGFLADLLGFRQVDVIEAWLPLFLFSVLFGLSMDYHVFLLSRIREHFDKTLDNTRSVAYGLRTTGKLITGAAVIMVAVFGGFAAGDLVMMQQMGFGLAVAVFLDATVVRSVLVPASMKLLGDRNWYLPSWLGWLPAVNVEGTSARTDEKVLEPATLG
jgi:putative drug exporter of the RND superfamily